MARLLYTKPIYKLTEREWTAFEACNMGGRGSMRRQVNYLRDRRDKVARAVLCWEGDTLIGCACIFGEGASKTLYTYVRENYRRQGVGTAIVAHARRGRKAPLKACPWDDRSHSFYGPMIASGKCKNAYAF